MLDPSEHLGLLGKVIRQTNVPPHLVDEAWSEGLVAITLAASSYCPSCGAQAQTWLYLKCRWHLKTWLGRERRQVLYPEVLGQAELDDSPARLAEVVEASQALPEADRVALMATACGYPQAMIARRVKTKPGQIQAARQRLKEELGMM